MKTIRLTESQLHRLIETSSTNVPNFDNGDIKDYNGYEVTATSNVTNQDGEKEYGKPTTTDKFQSNLTTQNNYGLNTRVTNRRMP